MINSLQNMIDKTDYWDMRILDIKAHYFGDEIEILIENDEETCWKISFLSCKNVVYNTDSGKRKINNVKNMKKSQLGYYGQDITVSDSSFDDFYKINLDFSIMEMEIECRNIIVEQISLNDLNLFWSTNE